MLQRFWAWYEKRYRVIAPLTAGLFLLQLVHLYWMTTNVVFFRLYGYPLWNPSEFWNSVIAIVDYTEIPAIITSTLLYLHQLRQGGGWRSILFLILINSQWVHLFWITDEIIYANLTGAVLLPLPAWLSWLAISIDYLELPVIFDTIRSSLRLLRNKKS
ncbi:MAG: hypothetical protein WC059_02880 [Candidatus Paceibacterota bacterium]